MKPEIWKKTFFSIPFVVFLGITGVDAVLYFVGSIPEVVRILREGVLLATLLLLIPFYQQLAFFKEKRMTRLLRNTFGFMAIAYALLTLNNFAAFDRDFHASFSARVFQFAQHFVFDIIAAIGLVLLILVTLGQIRSLVLYKSKGKTLRNFRLLLLSMIVFATAASVHGREVFRKADPFDFSFFGIAFGIMLLLSILNSTRSAWINFLNRRQKWLTFLFMPFAVWFGVSLTNDIRTSFIAEYSLAWAAIIRSVSLFFAIYAGVSGLLILLHLPTAGLFDEKVKTIRSLQELTKSISHYMEKNKLMATITEMAARVTKSDYAWLGLYEENDEFLHLASSINLTEEEQNELTFDDREGVSAWVKKNRSGLIVNNTSDDPKTSTLPLWKKDIGALLAVPLTTRKHLFGVLFSAKKDAFSYDEFDRDILQSFAEQAAIAFDNARLFADSLERERLAHELQIARRAQEKLLPKSVPLLPGIEVDGISIAARQVGGDYYDFFVRGNSLAVIIGDVSGKGAAAAFYMAEVKGVIEALGNIFASPREVLIRTNEVLRRSLEKKLFVTLLYANFDPENAKVTFCRAGHSPLLWYPHSAEPRFLQPAGIGIGLDDGPIFDASLEEMTVEFSPGDFFVFFTDGLTEARDILNNEFEEKRLINILREQKFHDASSLKKHILKSIDRHVGVASAHDDFTIVVVGISAQSVNDATLPAQAILEKAGG